MENPSKQLSEVVFEAGGTPPNREITAESVIFNEVFQRQINELLQNALKAAEKRNSNELAAAIAAAEKRHEAALEAAEKRHRNELDTKLETILEKYGIKKESGIETNFANKCQKTCASEFSMPHRSR